MTWTILQFGHCSRILTIFPTEFCDPQSRKLCVSQWIKIRPYYLDLGHIQGQGCFTRVKGKETWLWGVKQMFCHQKLHSTQCLRANTFGWEWFNERCWTTGNRVYQKQIQVVCTWRSKIFDSVHRMEIGRTLFIHSVGPFLCRGVTFASFHWLGKAPFRMLQMNMT